MISSVCIYQRRQVKDKYLFDIRLVQKESTCRTLYDNGHFRFRDMDGFQNKVLAKPLYEKSTFIFSAQMIIRRKSLK